ncbi:YqcC family protein [Thorsellia anophelis]|uniref:Uncharacterized conserved protein YqcC, DUF446 family n=1 Tax=Thorsellia anophelis DSM 18579 TaxID=1123402 RepID=A0A1I0BXW1_9GAMM|nr:YqcC family protein [Thorsellia anophelis]SET11910.1 Uncharacterized conserved protein YqcC, DUF446 family [Thorsellia anophelis DSM 18579]
MNEINNQLIKLLYDIENELRKLGLWMEVQPSKENLMSKEPFSIDKLSPSEWLQWIFIPKMQDLLANQIPIPKPFSISHYFEESYKDEKDKEELIKTLQVMDGMINEQS